ncbi:MAG: hypothetical protein KDB73_15965 [Planctomycetes bacterium]|nr:hypothetical protein [Planctomycetota bacterium]
MPRLHVAGVVVLALATTACTGPRLADSMAPAHGAAVFGSGSDDYGLPPVLPNGRTAQPAPAPVAAPSPVAPAPAPRPVVVSSYDHPAPPPSGFTHTAWEGDEEMPVVVEDAPVPFEEGPIVEDAPITLEEDVVIETPIIESSPRMPLAYQGAPSGYAMPCAQPCGSPCAPKSDCCCPSHYFEFGPEVIPGIGGGFNFGWRFSRSRNVTWAAEIGASYQDLWEEFIGEGLTSKYWAIRLGLKAEFGSCNDCFRWFAKGGLTLFELAQPRSEFPGDEEFSSQDNLGGLIDFNKEGSCLGLYAGFGFDWKVGRNWTIGPEIGYFIGENLSRGGDMNRSPYFRLNIAYNF